MSLSGPGLLWVLGVLTAGLPLLAVVLWGRLRGPRTLVVPARVTMVVAAQLAAVLLVGAVLNDYGYFYGTWGDLWGSVDQSFGTRYPVAPVTSHRDGSPSTTSPSSVSQVRTRRGYSASSRWARTGRLEGVHIHGDVTGLGTSGDVYLPPQYFQRRYRRTSFPAVEVISGYPATERMLVQRLAFQRKLAHEIVQHRAGPMVLVLLRPELTFPRDTECTDVPGGPQAETFYAQDVPRAMAGHYRVSPTGWGMAGVSTGGYCATKITMEYPTTFRAAVSLSGYYHALQDGTTGDLWGGSQVLRDLNSPIWRLQHQPAPPVSLLVTSSLDERGQYGYQDTRAFVRLARPPLRVSTIITRTGGHAFSTWSPEIPEALRWLSARLHAAESLTGGTTPAGPPPAAPVRSARAPLHSGGHRPRRAAG
ncbi:MAG: alpha/beta hydrolase-fold protein [Nocardioidaceae bacterium]